MAAPPLTSTDAPLTASAPTSATAAAVSAPIAPRADEPHAVPGSTHAAALGSSEVEHALPAGAGGAGAGLGGGDSFIARATELAKPYLDQAKPYIDKAQAQAKPYADAAMQKGREMKAYIDGQGATGEGAAGAADIDHVTGQPRTGPAGAPGSEAANAENAGVNTAARAQAAFGYGLASMKSHFNTLATTIDAKTATPEKPGLFTQMSSAVQSGVAQVQKAVAPVPGSATTPAGGAATAADVGGTGAVHAADTGSVPGATAVDADGKPEARPAVMTTTNAVAHNDSAGDVGL